VLIAAVAAAALLAGLAGAWSPCGFSMVDTVAAGGRRAAVAAGALAFALGALGGAVATFGGLALLGRALGTAGGAAAAVAATALFAASAGDAGGRRLVPQVRRQVPESWRRRLPVPLAAGLYGVLLGLGFTTFLLSFATYGLAIACLALGDPAVGLAAGLAFGAGRAIPVLALAPLQQRDAGLRAAAAMAERPGILRGLRAAAALAMLAAAAVLALGGAPAYAQAVNAFPAASDPSGEGAAITYEDTQGHGWVIRDGQAAQLPGSDPALGGTVIAWIEPGRIVVADLATLQPVATVPATGADALAVNDRYLAWRWSDGAGTDRLTVLDRAGAGAGPRDLVSASTASAALGAPALDGNLVVFHLNGRSSSRLLAIDLLTDRHAELMRARGALLLNPTLRGDRLLFVRSSARRQQLVLRTLSTGVNAVLYGTTPTARRDAGVEGNRHPHHAGYANGRPAAPARPAPGVVRTLWTTTLTAAAAYVTVVRPATADILRVTLPTRRARA
jgi:hypothetical protein